MNESITSVSDYLLWVKSCHDVEYGTNNKLSCYQEHVYFRGHASSSWELVPFLFRDKECIHDEHELLQRANNLLWSELSDCKSELEKIVRLQHYGLMTRLLDVTYNPLVALYFACQQSADPCDAKDGVVYCGFNDNDGERVANAIAEYVFNNDAMTIDSNEVDRLCRRFKVGKSMLERMHLFNPPFNNQRIVIQNGAFIMPPLIKADASFPFNRADRVYIKKEMETAFSKRIIVPQNSKTPILNELDYLGFNKSTIFRDIIHSLEYINGIEARSCPNVKSCIKSDAYEE